MRVTFAMLAIVLASSCSAQHPLGSARLQIQSALDESQIDRVAITVSGAGFASFTFELAKTGSTWGGLVSGIPAGSARNFHGEAYAAGVLEYAGDSGPVDIAPPAVASILLVLRSVTSPPTVSSLPVLDSLVLSTDRAAAGGTINLSATAHDPDPAATLAFAWTATAGSFDPPDAARTTWTAPAAPGPATLTLVLSNGSGSISTSVAVTVTDAAGSGAGGISISFSNPPKVSSITAAPTTLVPGQPTQVTVSAIDPAGATIAYAWSTDCADASLSMASSATAIISVPAGTADASCKLSVAITGGDGTNTATLLLAAGTSGAVEIFPQIDGTYQSSASLSAPGAVGLFVSAHSPVGSALTYQWSAQAGALGQQVDGADGSAITWTFASCAAATDTATVVVRDESGGTATASFSLTEACPLAPAWPAQFGDPQRSSRSANVGPAAPNERFTITPQGAIAAAHPLVDGQGRLYATFASLPQLGYGPGSSFFAAIDPSTGAEIWRFADPNLGFYWAALGQDGTVYIPCWSASDNQEYLYALNRADGSVKWSVLLGVWQGWTTLAAAPDGNVYLSSSSGHAYSVSPAGVLRWTWPAQGATRHHRASAYSPDFSVMYIATGSGNDGHDFLYALRLSDQTLLASFQLPDEQNFNEVLVAPDGDVIASSGDPGYWLLVSVFHFPAVTGPVDSWSPTYSRADRGGYYIHGGVDLNDTYYTLFQFAQQDFFASNASGLLYDYGDDVGMSSFAIGGDGTLYAGINESVKALHPEDGTPIWEYQTGSLDTNEIAIGIDGTLFVTMNSGQVLALQR